MLDDIRDPNHVEVKGGTPISLTCPIGILLTFQNNLKKSNFTMHAHVGSITEFIHVY